MEENKNQKKLKDMRFGLKTTAIQPVTSRNTLRQARKDEMERIVSNFSVSLSIKTVADYYNN